MPSSGSTENLIAELERLGITVWAQDGRLRYKAPQGSLTPELKQRLTDNKDRLLTLLSGYLVHEAFFFGPGNQRIFANYHPAAGGGGAVLTVICPPLFSDYMRTHLALRELAMALAERGQHVLRLDYRGTGDSFGDLSEVAISDWVEDITLAVRQGREKSGSTVVRLLGVRAGALLACKSLGASSDVQVLRGIQAALCERNPYLSRAERRDAMHEYAGYTLSERMVEELRLLDRSAYSSVPKNTLHVVSTSSKTGFPVPGVPQDVAPFRCDWDTAANELIVPRPVLERLIACLTQS